MFSNSLVLLNAFLNHCIDEVSLGRWWLSMAGWYRPPALKGMYMHGTVGTGKTFLMDLFYNQVPVHKKRRVHFHSFMLASLCSLTVRVVRLVSCISISSVLEVHCY